MPSVVRTRTSPMRKSALIMERGEALAGSGPADHLCDPPSRELCNPLMRRPLRPYTKIVDATVGSTSDFIGASWRSEPSASGAVG